MSQHGPKLAGTAFHFSIARTVLGGGVWSLHISCVGQDYRLSKRIKYDDCAARDAFVSLSGRPVRRVMGHVPRTRSAGDGSCGTMLSWSACVAVGILRVVPVGAPFVLLVLFACLWNTWAVHGWIRRGAAVMNVLTETAGTGSRLQKGEERRRLEPLDNGIELRFSQFTASQNLECARVPPATAALTCTDGSEGPSCHRFARNEASENRRSVCWLYPCECRTNAGFCLWVDEEVALNLRIGESTISSSDSEESMASSCCGVLYVSFVGKLNLIRKEQSMAPSSGIKDFRQASSGLKLALLIRAFNEAPKILKFTRESLLLLTSERHDGLSTMRWKWWFSTMSLDDVILHGPLLGRNELSRSRFETRI
ncbi:sugar transporter [Colletotrichum orchidophilum]|uniref:Sugar transporter n=1 Tax=Colletotrichum orchidophilum TaxID=1209926 RepID=A0A1G4AXH9_9PEZI|nr:sugar transporter [Colletotrichum orchidophilum]OHE93793.1 sugar transporter [Colletotrichum orchidophilum]